MERRLRPPFFLCGKTWTISGWHTKTPSQGLRRYMEASKNSISSPPFLRQLLSCVAVKLFQRFIRRFECTTTIRHRRIYISTDGKFITNRSHGWGSTLSGKHCYPLVRGAEGGVAVAGHPGRVQHRFPKCEN